MSSSRSLEVEAVALATAARVTDLANSLASAAEARLSGIARETSRMDVMLTLLEHQLNSVEGLSAGTIHAEADMGKGRQQGEGEGLGTERTGGDEAVRPVGVEEVTTASASVPTEEADESPGDGEEEEAGGVCVKDHPDLAKFFKMLLIGVPPGAVKQKMAVEGFDGALLDTPDATYQE